MDFDAGTWWLVGIIVATITGALTYLIKRAVFGKVDKIETRVENIEQNYTPKTTHTKDFDECKNDIKKIKEDYITKDDFFRVHAETNRKLDRILDFLLKKKGDT